MEFVSQIRAARARKERRFEWHAHLDLRWRERRGSWWANRLSFRPRRTHYQSAEEDNNWKDRSVVAHRLAPIRIRRSITGGSTKLQKGHRHRRLQSTYNAKL